MPLLITPFIIVLLANDPLNSATLRGDGLNAVIAEFLGWVDRLHVMKEMVAPHVLAGLAGIRKADRACNRPIGTRVGCRSLFNRSVGHLVNLRA